jgi:hypothetical protein
MADPLARPNAGEAHLFMGVPVVSGVPAPALKTARLRAYPNPSYGSMTVAFVPSPRSRTGIMIYDVRGRHVRTLVEGRAEGAGSVAWDGTGARGEKVPAGVYFVRMVSGAHEVTRRIVLLR